MTSKHLDKTNSAGSRFKGKRLNDYKVGISLGLIALITWLAARNNSGGACLAGACLKAALSQPAVGERNDPDGPIPPAEGGRP